MNGGYVLLHRKLLENPLMSQVSSAWFRVFIAILLKVNWKPAQWWDGTENLTIPAGSMVTSIENLRKTAGCTTQEVRGALRYLSVTHTVTKTTTNKYTILTVTNWATYQAATGSDNDQDESSDNQLATNHHQTNNKLATTIEEGNKGTITSARASRSGRGGNPRGETPPTKELDWVAERIQKRHPPIRTCGLGAVKRSLQAIVADLPPEDKISKLVWIDHNHEGWCTSPQWTKNNGEYAKGLEKWLDPKSGHFDIPAPEEEIEDQKPKLVMM